MTITGEQAYELRKIIKKLEKVRAPATELISLYIPKGFNINDVKTQLATELSLSSNIKSKQTRKAVLDSIEKVNSELKQYVQTPPKGIAIFAGDFEQQQSKANTDLIVIDDPPEDITTRMYRCDQKFILDPIINMIEAKNVYALISMDKTEAAIALLKGTSVKVMAKLKSLIPGKFRAGGQSAVRFSRVRENLTKYWYEEISFKANEVLDQIKDLKGIVLGGPSQAKEEMLKEEKMHKPLRDKIIGVIDTGYSGEDGIRELVQKSEDLLSQELIFSEKKLLTDFFGRLAKGEKVTYGLQKVIDAIQMGAVEKVILSEGLDEKTIDDIEVLAHKYKTEVILVSTNTEEGDQFKLIGGVGGLLRYDIGDY
ncbi:Peptide chain release factor subunit 1 [Candidatus Tiddalikarchaeum anstoanum]|nr:Peptide chain release factor subunit 1 [Candidatus Tiddalikarchaeum anstoanum]